MCEGERTKKERNRKRKKERRGGECCNCCCCCGCYGGGVSKNLSEAQWHARLRMEILHGGGGDVGEVMRGSGVHD